MKISKRQMIKSSSLHTQMNPSKTGEIGIRLVDCIKVNMLAVTSYYYSCSRGFHWGKWTKGTQDLTVLFLTTTCESTIISINFQFKKSLIYLFHKIK